MTRPIKRYITAISIKIPVSHITPYPYIVDYDTLHAAIRDDTLQRKVFLYRFNDYGTGDTFGNCPLLEEFLLYDFDLEVGDTLPGLCLFYSGLGDVVIDSIYTSEHHDYSLKTFLFHSYLGDLQDIEFLERIGFHDSGIFNNDFPFLSFNPVLHEYCIGDDCDYLLSAKEPIGKSTRLRVYPNPATSHIRLALSDYQPGNNHRLHITDSMGKVFLDEALSFGESTHTVSVADWPAGVYFIQYFADGVLWEVERIVVLH
ncbi:MAG: T9SS type A sorting domain-containing protein [Saprospirales bacterium]|nr:T9SS type A sorting domain-containing protein [Saprospirales bacterium]